MPNGFSPNPRPASAIRSKIVFLHRDRVVQLEAELADEVDPERMGRRRSDIDLFPGQPGEKLWFDRSASVSVCRRSRERGAGDDEDAPTSASDRGRRAPSRDPGEAI